MRTALTIAGSDSSGGAGIQADIKTMTMNGVFAMSAITALTAQNTTGVTAIFDTTPQFLAQQLDAVRAGEHHVEHDQLGRRFLLQGVPERVAVGEAPGLKAGGCERVHLDVADARIVLHAPDHPCPPL